MKIFIILLILTILNAAMGFTEYTGTIVISILSVSIWIKGMLIIDYFMHLKNAPKLWKRIVHGWLLTVTTVIAWSFI